MLHVAVTEHQMLNVIVTIASKVTCYCDFDDRMLHVAVTLIIKCCISL